MMVKAILNRGIEALRRFRDDVRGVVLPFVGVLAILMVVVVGAGIDYGRAINEREVMAHALDASALALASQLSTTVMTDDEIEEFLKVMFQANLSALGYKDLAVENLTHNVKPDAGVVTVRSSVTMPTIFIGIGGIGPKTLTVGVNSEVNYSKFDVELALVLDVTGSMSADMETLRQASLGLVNTLIPDGTSEADSKVRISVIPYSQGVNLGSYATTVTNGESSWRNCVTERVGDEQFTDAPYDYDQTRAAQSFFGGGSNNCSQDSAMIPLTGSRAILVPAIQALNDQGGTAGQTGIAWGWYSLSPNWANLWPAKSAPGSYSDDDILKFAIIMTDGDNNRFYDYDYERIRCGYRLTQSGYRYSCEPEVCAGWCEIPEPESYNNTSSTRARELCAAMHDAEIDVYGIYFGNDNSSTGALNMQSCASDANNYYRATSSSELIGAFGNIAKKIQAIYLAK